MYKKYLFYPPLQATVILTLQLLVQLSVLIGCCGCHSDYCTDSGD